MSDRIDQDLDQTINEVTDIYADWRGRIRSSAQYGDLMASILTLATVAHTRTEPSHENFRPRAFRHQ